MADNPVMDKAGELLGKKYGPLPFGAWLGIIAVGAFVARKYVASNKAAKAVQSDEGYVVDSNGNQFPSAYKGTGGGVPFGSGTVTSASSQQGSVTSPTEIDNKGWLKRAADKLQAAGMWNPLDVQSALTKYIYGEDLSSREQSIVNQAITMEGRPNVSINVGNIATSSRITGFVRPAGKAGVFAQYDDGSLVYLRDANQQWQAIASAGKQGVDTTIKEIPVNDPVWRNADVVKNNDASYLWGEHWAHYVAPNSYINQGPDIITNQSVIQSAREAWNRSKQLLPDTWSESAPANQRLAWASGAYSAAFGN